MAFLQNCVAADDGENTGSAATKKSGETARAAAQPTQPSQSKKNVISKRVCYKRRPSAQKRSRSLSIWWLLTSSWQASERASARVGPAQAERLMLGGDHLWRSSQAVAGCCWQSSDFLFCSRCVAMHGQSLNGFQSMRMKRVGFCAANSTLHWGGRQPAVCERGLGWSWLVAACSPP
ncbi:uncharacterized protein BKA78DRAFT_108189 [Phyllosticta capitalensis]|uniref:uncharacterized protein n=1 Tax=Phyllosticta capitalensis TaxID=121624 RepID=UPI00312E8E74